jgi:hypothetical protein
MVFSVFISALRASFRAFKDNAELLIYLYIKEEIRDNKDILKVYNYISFK